MPPVAVMARICGGCALCFSICFKAALGMATRVASQLYKRSLSCYAASLRAVANRNLCFSVLREYDTPGLDLEPRIDCLASFVIVSPRRPLSD